MSSNRRYKVEWLKEKIETFFKKNPKGEIDKKKLLAVFALENDTTTRTGNEILNLLVDTGFCKMKGDNLIK